MATWMLSGAAAKDGPDWPCSLGGCYPERRGWFAFRPLARIPTGRPRHYRFGSLAIRGAERSHIRFETFFRVPSHSRFSLAFNFDQQGRRELSFTVRGRFPIRGIGTKATIEGNVAETNRKSPFAHKKSGPVRTRLCLDEVRFRPPARLFRLERSRRPELRFCRSS